MLVRSIEKEKEEECASSLGIFPQEIWNLIIDLESRLAVLIKIASLSKELRYMTNLAIFKLILFDFCSFEPEKRKRFLHDYRQTEHYKLLEKKFTDNYEMSLQEKICFVLTMHKNVSDEVRLLRYLEDGIVYAKSCEFNASTIKRLESLQNELKNDRSDNLKLPLINFSVFAHSNAPKQHKKPKESACFLQ